MSKKTRIAGINFSHMHMGDLLRDVVDHSDAELVGICDEDPAAMQAAIKALGLPDRIVHTDWQQCMDQAKPDLVVLCPPTGEHALWVERIAPYGKHLLVEKPFAESLADADRMIAAVQQPGQRMMINWPIRWAPCYYTMWRLITDGVIGEVTEIHYYGGNRGPLYHGADKTEHEPTSDEKQASWWYKKEFGGGSLRDYLGYGATFGTWFNGGQKPIEITAVTFASPGIEVDEHCIAIARYENGLSKLETRWGTFTDPWTHQPQPKCGFVVRGTSGTIASYDYEATLRIQTRDQPEGFEHPVEQLPEGERNGIDYAVTRLASGRPIEGPLSPSVARVGQQIIETTIRSVEQRRTVKLVD